MLIILAACQHKKSSEIKTMTTVPRKDSVKIKFTVGMVQNKKDFICGMPVTAGISDTIHYRGKVYSFCSEGCKDEFRQDLSLYISKK